MEPMRPMAPMEPMDMGPAWWPENLGEPNASGSQNGMRYAFFAGSRRLVIECDGKRDIYDSGDHSINGVSQQQSQGQTLAFSSQNGIVKTEDLTKIS